MSAARNRDAEDDLSDLRARLREIAEDVGLALFGEPSQRSRNEWRWGNRGSLVLTLQGPKRGLWFDHEAGQGGDLLAAIHRSRGGSFRDAIAFARALVGDGTVPPGGRRKRKREPSFGASRYARRLFTESTPVTGTLAERYLREHRGIDGPLPTELRFHPAVWSKDASRTHPALLFPAFDGDQVRRVQAVLLDPVTAAKATLQAPKITFGAGAKHVPGNLAARCDDAPTVLAEGPEDAISIWSATGFRVLAGFGASSLPAIAATLSADTDLVVFSDNDEAGRKADQRVAEVFPAVRFARAPAGIKDANALMREQGGAAIRAAIYEAAPLQAPTCNLPAYYPAPTEPLEEALTRQGALITETLGQGALGAFLNREIERRRAQAITDGMEPTDKARITRKIKREVLAERALNRMPEVRRVLISGSQGSSKTTQVLRRLAATSYGVSIWHTSPTREKAAEAFSDYRAKAGPNSLPGMWVLGRSAPDPHRPGHKMCDRHEVVERATGRASAQAHLRKLPVPRRMRPSAAAAPNRRDGRPRGFLRSARAIVHSRRSSTPT